MIGIYKIQNLINGKIYIGQSIHIERRWAEHCQPSADSLIGKAIKKYGKENFSFQILEECGVEKLDELEDYYINKNNSVTPNGYNVETSSFGGKTSFCFYDQETLKNIYKDIEHSELTFQEIAEKYGLSLRTIIRLNLGDVHYSSDIDYPIRKSKQKKERYCENCGTIISAKATLCLSCAREKSRKAEKPDRETLKKLIRNNSFAELGRQFGISDNAVRKWCKGYNLPYQSKAIKEMSNKEWEKV